jgi:hypothetical protein
MNSQEQFESSESACDLIATLQQFADAGIDPAFDAELDELERQFAELRCTRLND